MKIVAKCLSLQPISSDFKDYLCNPIPLIKEASKNVTIFKNDIIVKTACVNSE